MVGCNGCGTLTEKTSKSLTLYLAPSMQHTRGTLRCLLWKSNLPFSDMPEGTLAVELSFEELGPLMDLLDRELSEPELMASKGLLAERGSMPGLIALSEMQNLRTLRYDQQL